MMRSTKDLLLLILSVNNNNKPKRKVGIRKVELQKINKEIAKFEEEIIFLKVNLRDE